MSAGPTTQFRTSDKVRTLGLARTEGSWRYFTFASGGYIITISPTAKGRFVVPSVTGAKNAAGSVTTQWPTATPSAIAAKIQRVR